MRLLTHAFLITTEPSKLTADDPRLEIGTLKTTVVSNYDFRQKSHADLQELCDADAFILRYGMIPTPGAIGCAAAHRHCHEILVRERGDSAIIMEDDVEFACDISEIVSDIHTTNIEYDVLSLKVTYGVYARRAVAECSFGRLFRATLYQYGAHVYLIHRDCAARFGRAQRPIICHLADWPFETWQFRCFGLETEAVRLSHRPSTVNTGHQVRNADSLARKRRLLMWNFMRFYRLRVCGDMTLQPGLRSNGN
jgi:GR25 family glycosyltransferase involved in LPS biosynthesis